MTLAILQFVSAGYGRRRSRRGAVTAPAGRHGRRRRKVFDPASKYALSDTLAYGTPLQQTFTFERDNYGQMTARIDPLGRRTEYGCNGKSMLDLAGIF